MAKQKAPQQPRELTPLEKLGLRVSAMINSPKAQLDRQVTIHRMDTDPDEAWQAVLELLLEEDALEVTLNDDGTVANRELCLRGLGPLLDRLLRALRHKAVFRRDHIRMR